ncbi:hypothetical protein V2H45_13235 [Tumidithrix elongata RA019]|uniref:Uncharacterized protein n=1 Tax=Tumidithrix elongata BACA0141 TaxID=2716417 RepID=A0AAW9Q3E0_9CYAN|nr:hypothetical protein [Tumidithrix elongata RA019]
MSFLGEQTSGSVGFGDRLPSESLTADRAVRSPLRSFEVSEAMVLYAMGDITQA